MLRALRQWRGKIERNIGLSFVLLTFCVSLCMGQTQYTRSTWKVQDGLPEATVQALLEAADGTLWVGTTGGLAHFDGAHFSPVGSSSLSAAGVSSIFCLTAAGDGSLWIGTEGGGLLHLKQGGLKIYNAAAGLTDGFVRSVLVDHRGTVWVGTDSALYKVAGDRVERVEVPAGTAPFAVHSIAEDHDGRIWVGGSRLISIENGHARLYTLPGSYSSNRVKTVVETADHTLWVGTVSGLDRLVNDHFVRDSPINSTVRTLKQTSDGTLWIGTIGDGLWTYKGGSFTHLDGFMPSNTVLAILEDHNHQIWFGLQDRLVRLSSTPVRVVALPGHSDSDFETISGDGGGPIWAVASQVYRITSEVANGYRFHELPPSVKVRNVFHSRSGETWIGTDGSGVYRLRAAGMTHYLAPAQLTNNFVRAILETRKGEIWVATDEGANRITPLGTQKIGVAEGLIHFSTRSLLEDAAGDIWIGTDQGLSHWRHDHFVHDAATDALSHEKVWSIFEGPAQAEGTVPAGTASVGKNAVQTLWFGTRDHGLFAFNGRTMTHLTTQQGLLSDSIYEMLDDHRGRIWLSGPNSISSVPEEQLERAAHGALEPVSVSTYAMPYGAEDAQFYGGRQPAGYVDPAGTVWLPSSKGVVHVVLTKTSIPAPPRLTVNKVTLDGRDLPLTRTIAISSHMTRLEIQFGPQSLRTQSGLRYRFRLEGFDKSWNNADSNLTASYTNLPSGDYRFLVSAYDIGSPGVTSEAELFLHKDPQIWQRWWFLALCLGAVSLLVWVIYRARMHQVKLRFMAVLDERGRLAREMHDTVIQGCTSVSALLEAMAMTAEPAGAEPQPQDELLRHARNQVRVTINEARHTIWNLRHEDPSPLDLAGSLYALSTQTSRESGVAVLCDVFGEAYPIAGFVSRELLMVVREAVYNAVRHGAPRTVMVAVRFQPNTLVLTVSDDGRGFQMGDAPLDGHYGITGMRERLSRVGGALKITSVPGQGTEVILSIGRSHLKPALENGRPDLLDSADAEADLRLGNRGGRGR